MYGFRVGQSVKAIFFDNPYTQSRPFAVYLLNLARKNILKCHVNMVGNEFVQPGEVYYLEDRDLLTYSTTVSHTFGYNSSFATSIEGSYTHNPGEYIPTWLDIIGQGLYANQNQSNLVKQNRHDRADDSEPVTALTIDTTVSVSLDNKMAALVGGVYKQQNVKGLANALLAVQGFLTPSDSGKSAKLEIRTYKNSNAAVNIPENTDTTDIADSIKEWVSNPSAYTSDGELLPDNNYQPSADILSKIEVITVDLNEDQIDPRSPSTEAWSKARIIAGAGQQGGIFSGISFDTESLSDSKSPDIKKIVNALINSVIDIWVVFEDVV
jgi:hypothetical protein